MHGLQSGLLTNLVTLELRGNSLETTHGLDLPHLRGLYLVPQRASFVALGNGRRAAGPDLSSSCSQAQNVIRRLEGLERLERLTTLHLRDNRLETLEGVSPSMTSLQYLNVRCAQRGS